MRKPLTIKKHFENSFNAGQFGKPYYEDGNDRYTVLDIPGQDATDVSQGSFTHPYYPVTAYFDGTGDYLTIPDSNDFTFAGDFTFEWWGLPVAATNHVVFDQYVDGSNRIRIYIDTSGTLAFVITSGGSELCRWEPTGIARTGWNFYQFIRSGNNLYLGVNGSQFATAPKTFTYPNIAANIRIGMEGTSSLYNTGWMADFRVSNIARTISLPTSPLVADANTKLLLPMNGTNQNFQDFSGTGKVVTRGGSTTQVATSTISPSAHPYAKTFFKADASQTAYISAPIDATLIPGANDWFIEGWVYLTSTTGQGFLSLGTGVNLWNPIDIYSDNVGVYFGASTNGTSFTSYITGAALSLNAWHHIAFCRIGSTCYAYIDGSRVNAGVAIGTLPTPTGQIWVGAHKNSVGSCLALVSGYMADWRVIIGTDSAIVSSRGFGTVTITIPSSYLGVSDFTKLSLPMNEGFTPVAYDQLEKQAISVGTTSTVKTFSKLPVADNAMFLNDSSSWITTPGHTDFSVGAGDITLEGWICVISQPTTGNQHNVIYITNSTNTQGFVLMYNNNGGSLGIRFNAGSPTANDIPINGGAGLTLGQWYHIAACRASGGATSIYVNGQLLGSLTQSASVTISSSYPTLIGYCGNGAYLLSEVRVSNSVRYSSNFAVQTSPFTVDANTKFLHHLNIPGAVFGNDDTGKAITTVSNAKVMVCQPGLPKALSFDGTVNCGVISPNSADYQFGSGDFTIEGWINLSVASAASTVIGVYGFAANSNNSFYIGTQGTSPNLVAFLCNGAGAWDLVSNLAMGTLTLGRWSHFAISRQGTNIRTYLDGVYITKFSTALGLYASTNNLGIGAGPDGIYQPWRGFIDWVHLVKGQALYTTETSFIPPTLPKATPFSKLIVYPGEKLTQFNDKSLFTKAITTNGTATQICGSGWVPQTTVGSFNGTTDYLSLPVSSDLNVLNNNFTLEGWFNTTSTTLEGIFYSDSGQNLYGGIAIYIQTGYLRWVISSNGSSADIWDGSSSVIPITTNTNYYFKLTKDGARMHLFLNGVKIASTSITVGTIRTATNIATIGRFRSGGGTDFYWSGYLSDFRMRIGIADNTFTVPTLPLVADKNTVLHLPMNGTTTTFVEKTGKSITVAGDVKQTNKLITNTGNVGFIPDATCPVDGRVMNFGGANNIQIAASSDTDFGTGDFTIDFWFSTTTVTGQPFLVAKWDGSTDANREWCIYLNSGVPTVSIHNGSTYGTVSGSSAVTINTWYHLAAIRASGILNLFLNGSFINSGSLPLCRSLASQVVYVGYAPSGAYLSGKMTQLRISKFARWTSDFIVPNKPYGVS